MADEGYDRTFPGDPTPPAKAPRPAASPAPASSPSASATRPGAVVAAAAPPAKENVIFRVVKNPDDGSHDIYRLYEDPETGGESDHWGTARNGDDVEAVLNASAQYDPATQSWDVPEAVARSVADGRLSFPATIQKALEMNEAGIVTAYNAMDFIEGRATYEDVVARNNAALLPVQLGPAGRPEFAWRGLGKQVAEALSHPADAFVDALKFSAGAAAGFAPIAAQVAGGAAAGAVQAGGPAAAAAAMTGTLELPPVLAAVGWLTSTGALLGASKTLIRLETGTLAADMMAKGLPPDVVKNYAAVGGAVKGMLWMIGFKYIPVPGKERVLGALATSEVAQKIAASWVAKYGGEVAGGTALGVAQGKLGRVIQNMAAIAADRPELVSAGGEKEWDAVLTDAITMAAGVAVMGAPGAVKAGLKAWGTAKAEAKLAAQAKAVVAKVEETQAAKPAPAPAAEIPGDTAPKRELTVDTEGLPPAMARVKVEGGDIYAEAKAPAPIETPAEKALAAEAVAPETVTASVESALAELGVPGAGEKDIRAPRTYEENIRAAEAKAAARAADESAAKIDEQILTLKQNRDRFERLGRSTALLDQQIIDLGARREDAAATAQTYRGLLDAASVEPNEKLSMKPATLESLVNLGYVEGKKEVLDVRRKAILDIAQRLELTSGDMRALRDRNYGVLSDAQFSTWLRGEFTEKAKAVKARKVALGELRAVQKEQKLVHSEYARQLAKLPVVSKMTNEQIYEYADILRSYDKEDALLRPSRVGAILGVAELAKTELSGARTWGEVRKRISDIIDTPEKLFTDRSQMDPGDFYADRTTPDAHLARRVLGREASPYKNFLVTRTKETITRADMAKQDVLRTFREVAAQAVKERKERDGSFTQRVGQWVAAQQKDLMAYLEADKAMVYAGQERLPDLTPSELLYAEMSRAFFDRVRKHLFETGELESTRFGEGKDSYFPHVARPLNEILKDVLGSEDVPKELKRAAAEIAERLQRPEGAPEDAVAHALGLRKGFKYTKFRTEKLQPSSNVFAVVDHVVHQFYDKLAYDEIAPFMDTALKAFEVAAKDPQAEHVFNTIQAFTNEYLNAKSGNASWIVERGGRAEAGIRLGMSLVSLRYIGAHLALQAMSPVGEATGTYMAIGSRGIARARGRRFGEQGRKILAKYLPVFGVEGPLEALHPGSDVTDAANMVLYGAFRLIRKQSIGDIILGSMTPEEFKSGELSAARITQIKMEAGRWVDLQGNKSARGSSVVGAEVTQFKGWAIPGLFSILEDVAALKDRVQKGKPIDPLVKQDFRRLSVLAVMATFAQSWVKGQVDEDTFAGKAAKYAAREVMSMFSGPGVALAMLGGGMLLGEVEKLGVNLALLAGGSRFTEAAGEKEGKLKGWDAIEKQFTPAAVRQFQTKEEKP